MSNKFENVYKNKYFKNTDADIRKLKPGKLIKRQNYLISYSKAGIDERFYTRFRGKFVEYKSGFKNILSNIELAVFEDVIVINSNNSDSDTNSNSNSNSDWDSDSDSDSDTNSSNRFYFTNDIYIVKNLYTNPKAYDNSNYVKADFFLSDIENSKKYNYYVGFNIEKWDFAPDIGRINSVNEYALNYLTNARKNPNLLDDANRQIDLQRRVMSAVGPEISGFLNTPLPPTIPYAELDSTYNNVRNSNDQNANDQNANIKKRGATNAELVEREFAEVDGGTRRRKTRRRKMRKNKTRSKKRKLTKRHRKY